MLPVGTFLRVYLNEYSTPALPNINEQSDATHPLLVGPYRGVLMARFMIAAAAFLKDKTMEDSFLRVYHSKIDVVAQNLLDETNKPLTIIGGATYGARSNIRLGHGGALPNQAVVFGDIDLFNTGDV